MLLFWILAAAMTLVALAFVLVPLLRPRAIAGPTPVEANLEVLRGQRHEIERDVADGTLPVEAREEALAELVGRARDDLEGETKPAPAASSRPWVAAAIVAVALPALAFGLYAAIGAPQATDAKATAAAERPPADEKQIVAMVESLALKVQERPDDAQGWALLARSMAAIGRFEESAKAYERLAVLVPGDASVLADWADALGMAKGRSLVGRPLELVRQALAIDPVHQKALALAGTAAMDGGDFAAALVHWQKLVGVLPADSPDAEQVRSIIADIRQRAAAAGKPQSGAGQPQVAALPPAAKAPRVLPPKTVSGSVSVSPTVASQVAGTETLFIFARAEGGPRVPLAVVRASARELPMKFALDDSQAMSPGMNISSAQSVRIEARISRSGNALPQPGDLVGTSAVVQPGASDVRIVVDKVLP